MFKVRGNGVNFKVKIINFGLMSLDAANKGLGHITKLLINFLKTLINIFSFISETAGNYFVAVLSEKFYNIKRS